MFIGGLSPSILLTNLLTISLVTLIGNEILPNPFNFPKLL